MDSLYIAMTGAKAILQRQTVTANNLANANTTGFRADKTEKESEKKTMRSEK